MHHTARFSALLILVAASGCVFKPMLWNKPGATQEEFAQAKYECLQQSQQTQSGAYVNPYGGAATTQVVTNPGLFGACMNAHGFYLQQS